MEILRSISLYADKEDKQFLIIGGHAINFYGFSRHTADLDILARRTDKEWWKELLEKAKYTAFQDNDIFSRFKPPEIGWWPIDLMYVDDSTFSKLWQSSVEAQFDYVDAKIVSAKHLITLKIHALREDIPTRSFKDYNDVIWLLKNCKEAKFSKEELEKICLEYADINLYNRIISDVKI